MAALMNLIPLALEGQWRGWAAVGIVLTAVTLLIGSIYVLLWGIYGAKVAYLVLGTSLFGFLIILSLIWLVGAPGTVPGTGPRGTEPAWVAFLPDSEQGQEFRDALEQFPDGWDKIGTKYPGGIDSAGEKDKARETIVAALARLAEFQGLPATKTDDWEFRAAGQKPTSPEEAALPAATVGFFQNDTPLLFGARIPATDKHREVLVFALRDKGKVFLPAAMFFVVSVVMFATHMTLLARDERRKKAKEQAAAEPARV